MALVDLFESPSGRRTVEKEVLKLPIDAQHAILLVAERWGAGIAPPGAVEKLKGHSDLWELKASVGRHQFRALAASEQGYRVLLVVFQKKSQQIPKAAIDSAAQRLVVWRRHLES